MTHQFGYAMPSFSLNSRKSLSFKKFLPWPSDHWVEICSVFMSIFLLFLLLVQFSCNPWWANEMQRVISIFLCLWGLLCAQLYGQHWRRFWEVLRRRYILLFWGESFFRYQLDPFVSLHPKVSLFLCLVSILMTHSLVTVGCWNPPLFFCGVRCEIWSFINLL